MKYKVVKETNGFGGYHYVIMKRTWLGFYLPINGYYFSEDVANMECKKLNYENKIIKNEQYKR